jgi:hypothetical protein
MKGLSSIKWRRRENRGLREAPGSKAEPQHCTIKLVFLQSLALMCELFSHKDQEQRCHPEKHRAKPSYIALFF